MQEPKVGIIGYYGASDVMSYENYEELILCCEEIIEKDFGLNCSNCHFIANGGSWMNHLPVSLAKKWSKKITFVFPRPWSESDGKYYNRNSENLNSVTKKLAGQMTSSHDLMKKRLKNKIDSRSEIDEFIKTGSTFIEKQNIKMRDQMVEELCNYLIFIPLTKNKSTNVKYGQTLYESFQGPKKFILLSKLFGTQT